MGGSDDSMFWSFVTMFPYGYRPTLIHDPPPFVPKFHRVVIHTASALMATAITHPLDYLRVRMQIESVPRKFTWPKMAKCIYTKEGPMTFYWGLRASLLRQFLNSGVRFSSYNTLYDSVYKDPEHKPSLDTKLSIGIVSGCLGAFLGTPAEVILNRIMASSAPRAFNNCSDLQGLIDNRYKGIFNAFYRIYNEEGLTALWRGGVLVQIRSVILTVTAIGGYAKVRDLLKKLFFDEGYPLHVATSCVTSFINSICTIPFDMIKTRYQIKRYGVTQRDVFNRLRVRGGPYFYWKRPFPPYYFRQTLHVLITFVFTEHLEYFYEGESFVTKSVKKEAERKSKKNKKN